MVIALFKRYYRKGRKMREGFTILIADRNPHVRELLKREMSAEGYGVRVAQNGHQVLKWSYDASPLDLLIMDPDLPDMDSTVLIERLKNRIPTLPMIIHAFVSDYPRHPEGSDAVVFLEKEGSSIESLKQIVERLLTRSNSTKEIPVEKK